MNSLSHSSLHFSINTLSKFSKSVAIGIICWIGLQAFVNIENHMGIGKLLTIDTSLPPSERGLCPAALAYGYGDVSPIVLKITEVIINSDPRFNRTIP